MKTLFALLLFITLAATACMSIVSRDFKLKDGCHFSIMKMELPQSSSSLQLMMTNFAPGTKMALLTQLNIDYIFMVGCYNAIAILCLIAMRRVSQLNSLQKDVHNTQSGAFWKNILMALAMVQLIAWGLDVWENAQTERWLHSNIIDGDILFFKARVYVKFGLAFAGFFTAVLLLLFTNGLLKKLRNVQLRSVNLINTAS
jgi:hypothetical protein